MPTYTLIIMLLSNISSVSGGMTSVPGYTSLEFCEAQARQIQAVRVDNGARRIRTACVEVK